jgi:hypothetical protein
VYRRLVHDRAFVGAAFAWGATRPKAAARKQVRFALLGCGDVGIRDAAATATAAELVACFDPVRDLAAEVADRFGAVATRDAEELLSRPDVDAVIIATPHDTHETLAVQALAAGKHVLLEKPLAVDLPRPPGSPPRPPAATAPPACCSTCAATTGSGVPSRRSGPAAWACRSGRSRPTS